MSEERVRRVVVGYDGSAGADSALAWVVDWTTYLPVHLDIVVVANMLASDSTALEDTRRRAEETFAALRPQVRSGSRCLDGTMPGTLLEASEDADLLVIGANRGHPARAVLHLWMPLRISMRSHVPTCVVPSDWTRAGGPISVGIAMDGSSEEAAAVAVDLAAASGRGLRLLRAWTLPSTVDGFYDGRVDAAAIMERSRDPTDEVADEMRAMHPGVSVTADLFPGTATIGLTVAASSSSLIVIGTHHRGVLAGGLFGSVAQDLIGSLDVPVLVVPTAR